VDGIINVNKPPGRTSFSVVAQLKRLSGAKRAGHAGTLDPDATGVLPVCLGRGTRVIEYLMDTSKGYRAEIALGAATDTYDAAGQVTMRGDASGITPEQIEAALEQFRGSIRQTPPMYSALKMNGRPLYELARAGVTVERKSRPVKIHKLEITAWQPPVLSVDVECSKGTYIRSLAHDLGEALGCGGHLKSLVRTRCGIFTIEDAVPLPHLEESFARGDWPQFLKPIDSVLGHHAAATVDAATELMIKQGKPVTLEAVTDGESPYCRAYGPDGRFLAILKRLPDTELWQPKKVLAD
jgi:tRNA pseudouridine55 synthase